MFALRNLIIHGNLFEKDIINNNDGFKYQVSGKASKIYAFFIENDLMKQTEIEFLDHYELNAKSVHFFIENVLQFVQEYSSFMQPKLSFNYLDIFNKMGLFEINYSVLKN